MTGRKCQADCTCKRHTARQRPDHPQNNQEYRDRRSEQMSRVWEERRQNTELMDSVKKSMSEKQKLVYTPERRQLRAKEARERFSRPESLRRKSLSQRGKRNGEQAAGVFLESTGYRLLTMQYDHPLAGRGAVLEHRKVLYDEIGPGPHECHWGCGSLLEWGGKHGICVDHLNGDKLDNRSENLVVSCRTCNFLRGLSGNPVDWNRE